MVTILNSIDIDFNEYFEQMFFVYYPPNSWHLVSYF